MPISRSPLAIPLMVVAALALLLASIAPVLAAPAGSGGGSRLVMTDHVAECDEITLDAEGNIQVGGELLTDAQLALLDAEVVAALALAAAADAAGTGEVCVDVEITTEGQLAVNVDAHIDLCPVTVEVDGDIITVDGIELDANLLSAELVNLLEAAAAAGIDACLFVTVDDNDVFVDLVVEACVMATLNEDGSLTVNLGGIELDFPADAVVDVEGMLEVGVEVEVGLEIVASLDIEVEEVFLEATVVVLEGCGEGEEPTEEPSEEPSTAPSGSTSPSQAVAPTLRITPPPTDGSVVANGTTAPFGLPLLLLVVSAGGLLILQARARRTN